MKNRKIRKQRKRISLFILGFLLVAVYLFALDTIIVSKFEARRWHLPSRIYSDSFVLHPGQKIEAERIERKLKRLKYRQVSRSASSAGEYTKESGKLTLYLNNFSYPGEEFIGFRAQIELRFGEISKIEDLETGAKLENLKLEPELITSVFDEKMEDRTVVPLSKIPEELIQAVVAIEDERFFFHKGIDLRSIARALVTDVLHLKLLQGGSTITQQLVKNFFLTSKKSFFRKFNEIWMALLLERRYSKEEILEVYFNEIYLGQRGPVSVSGVEEAARFYFGKSVSELSLAESVMIAGLVRNPGEYSPLKNKEVAKNRRDFILKLIHEKGFISDGEFKRAQREKIKTTTPSRSLLSSPHFVNFLQSEIKKVEGDSLSWDGLRIFSTLDAEMQEEAEKVVPERLAALEKEIPKVRKIKEEGKNLEGLLIAVEPQTGFIRAYVGGRDYQTSQFDRISTATRQPGSAFKPFVYATALSEKKWTFASLILDESFTIQSGGEDWSPKNYDEEEHGEVLLREALEQSYNIATAKLALDVGLQKIVKMAQRAGIESELREYPALALGAFEVTPFELIRAYTIFANQGVRTEPIATTSIVTRDGAVLKHGDAPMEAIISPQLAFLVTSGLKGVFERGTASVASLYGFSGLAAGKTGTTSDEKDSWFVGYNPELLALTWVGYDDGTSHGLTGASGALPLWVSFMKKQDPPREDDFPKPDGVVTEKIEKKSGKRSRFGCGESTLEFFLEGTEPREKCR